ncbi:hypothetical protein CHCC14820_0427 [Bacillus paralicheniformis]|uniref:Uncharacterized protein n=1 Tax=Bacillus paralicheniformis TaxID=1648923 RepID=A0ABY3FSS9_9BACI|nr:hypothetical protein SC10_B2orf05964 [Bacillus paralicheniformis]TWJ52391.1 hypothetical protein CHCC5022_2082 [Bacillus paralicheniformis]TWJ79623.1 hypothetical protein CHCC4186_2695 [Bacillus paralicheniformis]TWK50117.1 hypothetical protein CHCC20347_0348 [Bacillus paralicheniformis]TWK81596.1 hypothetical protein CHCC20331_4069 [Bacillus paralicheniformis]
MKHAVATIMKCLESQNEIGQTHRFSRKKHLVKTSVFFIESFL